MSVWKSFALDQVFLLEALGPGKQPPRNQAGRFVSVWPCQSWWSQMFGFVTPLSSIKSGLGFAGQTGEVACAELPFPALSALEES